MNTFDSPWFYWAVGIAIGLPIGLIVLTELHHTLVRRNSRMARQVSLLRNFLLPLGALLLLLIKASQISAGDGLVRILGTAFGFLVLVLLLSGLNATVFASAPENSWRKRLPTIFLDVARFALIGLGLAVILSFVWGVRVAGVFTALGVTSVVVGLMLQNSVGQIVSGLFMLFEQPFRINDWLDTGSGRGRVVEVNWRSVHIDTGSGMRVMPNSALASTSFTNLSRPAGSHKCGITTKFDAADSPDKVCAMLTRVAAGLPLVKPGTTPATVVVGDASYRTTVRLSSPADDGATTATFLRWVWYAARREELHLDGADDAYSTTERVQTALRTVVGPELRLSLSDQQSLLAYARVVRYGADEIVQYAGVVPKAMSILIAGKVRLTAPDGEDAAIPVANLAAGAFLGVTTLTRQPNPTAAYALEEVTAVEIDRDHLEQIVTRKPQLLQDLGKLIDERQARAARATRRDRVGKADRQKRAASPGHLKADTLG
jgi:small-conductance mechanosensitive channel/CRP-like cAMP-binding protein